MHRETTIDKKEVKWFHLSRERIMKKLERKDSCFKGMVTQLRNSSALGRVTEYFTVLNEYQERESRERESSSFDRDSSACRCVAQSNGVSNSATLL